MIGEEETALVEVEAVVEAPAPTYQPATLLDCAIRALGNRPEVLASRSNRNCALPIDLFMRVLQACPSHAISADKMKRIQSNIPGLVHENVDTSFWKPYVSSKVQSPIPMPYQVMVDKVVSHKKVLDDWVAASTANPKLLVPDDIKSILHELTRLPFSPSLLKDAMIATAVRAIAKLPHEKSASLARDLTSAWKKLVTAESEQQEEDPLKPAAIGKRATKVTTWKQVYEYSVEHDALKRASFAKRARAIKEEEEAKRQKLRVKDVAEEQAMSSKNGGKGPPVGNTDRVKKLVGIKPQIGHLKPKGAGGIKFVSNKDFKRK